MSMDFPLTDRTVYYGACTSASIGELAALCAWYSIMALPSKLLRGKQDRRFELPITFQQLPGEKKKASLDSIIYGHATWIKLTITWTSITVVSSIHRKTWGVVHAQAVNTRPLFSHFTRGLRNFSLHSLLIIHLNVAKRTIGGYYLILQPSVLYS